MTKKISALDISAAFVRTATGKRYYSEWEAAAKAFEEKMAWFDALYERREAEGASVEDLRALSDSIYEEEIRYRRERDKAFTAYEAAKGGWVEAMDAMDMIDWTD